MNSFAGIFLTCCSLWSLGNGPLDWQGSSSLKFTSSKLTASTGEEVAVERSTLTVRERHASATSPVIKLPVLRFRSTSANPGAPVVYLAGGPGASGIESAKNAIFPLIMALRDRADVIVFDQRGTGTAEPSLQLQGRFDLPPHVLIDSAEGRLHLVNKAREYAAETSKRGVDLSAYNTNENADDVEDLRIALDAKQIIVWGHSYGSHLALAYMRRHPASVERAILGGINGLDQRWRSPADLDALIVRIDDRMKEFPKLRRQIPDLGKLVKEVLDELEKEPVTVTVQGQPMLLGRREVEAITALMAGDLEFVISLPLFFTQMKHGDVTRVAQLTSTLIRNRTADTAMRYAMHIASGVSKQRAAQIAQQRTALFRDAINFPFENQDFVDAWGVADLGDEFRAPFKSTIPTLFLSGDLDGRTSISDANDVLRNFTKATQVIINGAAHDFYNSSPLVFANMQAFLAGKPVVAQINVPVQLRGPDEPALITELRRRINQDGIEAGLKFLDEISSAAFQAHASSYVCGSLAVGLWQQDKKPREAQTVLKYGLRQFPSEPFLNERLADVSASLGDVETARTHYRKCLEINPLNRGAALKLRRLDVR